MAALCCRRHFSEEREASKNGCFLMSYESLFLLPFRSETVRLLRKDK